VTRAPSLRTTLVAGLVLVNLAVIGGIAAVVYARARREAHAALRADLRLRAETLAGLLELGAEGLEFDLPPKALPEYVTAGSGAYASIHDADGRAVRRSPSLSGRDLPRATGWEDGALEYAEIDRGPDGFPCAAVTRSFLVRTEHATASWQPPPEEKRRWQIVVAADSRPRDEGLAALRASLAATAAGALGVTVLGGLLVARWVLAPVRRMTEEAAALTPEDTSRRLHPESVSRELASLSSTLNSALDRLGDALDRQRRFTSDASHELRTPLAVLRGNAELLLRRERTAAEYREGLERQRRIAVRMTEITENLLALARADGGRAQIRRTRVDLPGLARSVCDEFAGMAGEDGVALECAAGEDVAVDGDPTYLAGLVQNLVSNALKFTPRGGSVRVAVGRDDGHAVLDVADTGPGIPEQDRERVFRRFFRVHEGRDRHEGAGLGLAIVEWIVREHAGRIDVLDREGGGAVFRVRLPLGAAASGRPA
jgi:heavy metal sensor kinase